MHHLNIQTDCGILLAGTDEETHNQHHDDYHNYPRTYTAGRGRSTAILLAAEIRHPIPA